jgi:transcriptional regulator with XRE-family HTH domain
MGREFGEYVRARREALKAAKGGAFSLRRAAEAMQMSPGYLSKLETGEVEPGDETIAKLARLLQEPEATLFAKAGRAPRGMLREHPALAELLMALRDRPEADIREITRRIREGEW